MVRRSLLVMPVACALSACDPPPPAESPSAEAGPGASSVDAATSTSSAATTTGRATSAGAGGGTPSMVDYCQACSAPTSTGKLESEELAEVSGVVASSLHAGVYFTHNDSGDLPRFYAIDSSGKSLATYEVDGAFAVDWEDAAGGPCPSGSCLYLADIGDNLAKRTNLTIYRVVEPTQIEPGTHHVASEPLPFTYPDGSHDAETLLVHPKTGELFVVTKVLLGASSLYRFPMPLTPGSAAVLEKVGEVAPPGGLARFTAGAIHPEATGILLRAYTALYFYPMLSTVAETLSGEPCNVPVAAEKQGEAVDWTADGKGYVTVSEGVGASVNVVACR